MVESTHLNQKIPRQLHSDMAPPSSGPRMKEIERVIPTRAPTTSGRLGPCSRRHTCAKLYNPEPPMP
jgi:hypothetical protein